MAAGKRLGVCCANFPKEGCQEPALRSGRDAPSSLRAEPKAREAAHPWERPSRGTECEHWHSQSKRPTMCERRKRRWSSMHHAVRANSAHHSELPPNLLMGSKPESRVFSE